MTCSSEFCPISHELGKRDEGSTRGKPTEEWIPQGRALCGAVTALREQLRCRRTALRARPTADTNHAMALQTIYQKTF